MKIFFLGTRRVWSWEKECLICICRLRRPRRTTWSFNELMLMGFDCSVDHLVHNFIHNWNWRNAAHLHQARTVAEQWDLPESFGCKSWPGGRVSQDHWTGCSSQGHSNPPRHTTLLGTVLGREIFLSLKQVMGHAMNLWHHNKLEVSKHLLCLRTRHLLQMQTWIMFCVLTEFTFNTIVWSVFQCYCAVCHWPTKEEVVDSSIGNQEGFHRYVTFELGFESFPFGEGRNESIGTCMLKDMELWKVLEFSGDH